MIVKDEASNIQKVLEAAKPFIDSWTIIDTGSTDDTRDIVMKTLDGVPGMLTEEPFVDFATTRNRVMELNRLMQSYYPSGIENAEFQLMLSGDEYLKDGAALREYLETQRTTATDCHLLRLAIDEVSFFTPRVFRTGCQWRYEGIVHEVPYNRADANAAIGSVPRASIEHVVSDPEKRFSSIWENHIPLLEAKLEEEPNDERTLIFLAQSYKTLIPFMQPGEGLTYAMRAMSLYMRRLEIPTGSDNERNYVKFHYLDLAKSTGVYTPAEFLSRCTELCEADPQRPDTALLHVAAAKKVLPVLQVYKLAVHAANVASAAWGLVNSSPVSVSCGWEAHRVAAVCALQIAKKRPEATLNGVPFAELAQQHVAMGLEVGGPERFFQGIVEEATLVGVVKLTSVPQDETQSA